jgi:tryptophanyl-tRNA synthetase
VYKGDPGNPEICPIYLLHRIYTPDAENVIAPPCRSGELGCVDCKAHLARNLNTTLAPLRERRTGLLEKPDYVWDVLKTGGERARQRAENVMEKVRDAMKMNYRKGKK